MTPLRQQELVALCRVCKRPAERPCSRCGVPLCDAHGATDEQHRCERCELEFANATIELAAVADAPAPRLTPKRFGLGVLALYAVVLAVFAFDHYGMTLADLIAALIRVTVVVGVIGVAYAPFALDGKTIARWRLKRARQRFLAERKPDPPLLTDGEAPDQGGWGGDT